MLRDESDMGILFITAFSGFLVQPIHCARKYELGLRSVRDLRRTSAVNAWLAEPKLSRRLELLLQLFLSRLQLLAQRAQIHVGLLGIPEHTAGLLFFLDVMFDHF